MQWDLFPLPWSKKTALNPVFMQAAAAAIFSSSVLLPVDTDATLVLCVSAMVLTVAASVLSMQMK